MTAVKRIYRDVCALCRPFDDQQQARIRLETQAIDLILASIRAGNIEWVASSAHTVEINAIRQVDERQHLTLLLAQLAVKPAYDLGAVRQRAEMLTDKGMGVADAAHVAFAEMGQAEFVSVDDRLLKQCQRLAVKVWCGSPLAYCDKESLR
jgi:predicted nucleic acid-binding protein